MSQSIYFYLTNTIQEAEKLLDSHKEEFEILLGDSFSEDELASYSEDLEQLASVECQPMLDELSFDDFVCDPAKEEEQRAFFNRCKSSICLENVPYIENNPFQVTYLIDLLWMFEEVLVDLGGMSELMFKKDWIAELKRLRSMDSLMKTDRPRPVVAKSPDPLSTLVSDVYSELERVNGGGADFSLDDIAHKRQILVQLMQEDVFDPATLQKKSGLGLKDFGDALEGLKFFLKKLN